MSSAPAQARGEAAPRGLPDAGCVTAITARAGRPGRFDVIVDGRSVGAVSVDVIERLGLRPGGAFAPVRAAFQAEVALLATSDRAVGMLAARGRSRVELRRQLLRKGEPASHVDIVLERLEFAGYLNDLDFARQFARSMAARRGFSRRRIAQELGRRGVARDTAAEAIGAVYSEDGMDEADALKRVAARKLRSLAGLDIRQRRSRLYGFLARRGYSSDDVRAVVRRLCEATLDVRSTDLPDVP
jgi:regulatory protein